MGSLDPYLMKSESFWVTPNSVLKIYMISKPIPWCIVYLTKDEDGHIDKNMKWNNGKGFIEYVSFCKWLVYLLFIEWHLKLNKNDNNNKCTNGAIPGNQTWIGFLINVNGNLCIFVLIWNAFGSIHFAYNTESFCYWLIHIWLIYILLCWA